MNNIYIKRTDDLGRIVIPKEFRKVSDIQCGDCCEVSIAEDGTILIKKLNKEDENKL